jgi:hypothetical protein
MSRSTGEVDPHARFEPDARRLQRLRELLRATAATITYEQVAQALELQPPCTIRQVIAALERLMVEDAQAGRPLLAARVVSRTRDGLPAPGFFDLAQRLGCYAGALQGEPARRFHQAELARLHRSTLSDRSEPANDPPATTPQ